MENILSHVNMVDQGRILPVGEFSSWAELRLMYASLVCLSVCTETWQREHLFLAYGCFPSVKNTGKPQLTFCR